MEISKNTIHWGKSDITINGECVRCDSLTIEVNHFLNGLHYMGLQFTAKNNDKVLYDIIINRRDKNTPTFIKG